MATSLSVLKLDPFSLDCLTDNCLIVAVGVSGLAGAVPDTVPTLGRPDEPGVSHKSK